MISPFPAYKHKPINSLIGIKSSLKKIRSVVSLVYLLYLANGKKASVSFATIDGNSIQLKKEYSDFILNYLHDESLLYYISENPLLNSQIESLYVGITLMFRLGKISFENKSFSITKERTGGKRYPKVIDFSSNIMILDLIFQGYEEVKIKDFLKAWLTNNKAQNTLEEVVSKFLNISIENCYFKLRRADGEIIFQTEGIYKALKKDDFVSLETTEFVGPTRILNSMLSEDLIPWIKSNQSTIQYNSNSNFDYKEYAEIIKNSLDIKDIKVDDELPNSFDFSTTIPDTILDSPYILTALKTKPFLLLAGISGTGKSRIVRELAFKSCPSYLRDKDGTTPGNYCMIEVKPNWHDSSELLGYYSNISKKYIFKKFVKFLVKAKLHPEVPFFVCLDEMNLAPVEQYFAEFLSILETRKHPDNSSNEIKTGILIDPEFTKQILRPKKDATEENPYDVLEHPTDKDWYLEFFPLQQLGEDSSEEEKKVQEELINRLNNYKDSHDIELNGLSLPENLFVVGTVNMDDTTHQFSRKVIDRAMTIEMNGGKLEDMFGDSEDLKYPNKPDNEILSMAQLKAKYISADEVLDK